MLSIRTLLCTALFTSTIKLASAACECGFVDEESRVWMDALVLPFNKIGAFQNNRDIYFNDYTHSQGHGNYTYTIDPKNTFMENDALVLKVTPPVGTTVGSSQVSTLRKDLHYGTYRAVMEMPKVSGSCTGFFTYFNDTEEIDMEYLGQNPDTLYLSSKRTNPQDYSTDLEYVNLAYKESLHTYRDYRFDWIRESVNFFLDGKLISTMKDAVPSVPSRAMLMNWGNGDKDWSGGLPKEDILFKVKNVRVFFNTTSAYVIKHQAAACASVGSASDAYCNVATFSSTSRYGYEENIIRRFATGIKSSSTVTANGGGGDGNKDIPSTPASSADSASASRKVAIDYRTTFVVAFVALVMIVM